MGNRKLRLGILTGEGERPGLSLALPAIAKVAHVECSGEVVGIEFDSNGLIEEGLVRPLAHKAAPGIPPLGGTVPGSIYREPIVSAAELEARAGPLRFDPQGELVDGALLLGTSFDVEARR